MKSLTTLATALTLFASASQAAEIQIDPNLTLLSHNGAAQTAPDGRLSLSAGQQVLELRYSQYFQLSSEEHENVRSTPLYLVFNANDTDTYRLTWPESNNVEAARHQVANPVVSLTDGAGTPVRFELKDHRQLVYQLLLSQSR
ncbi:DUF2057 domain-containing protein [Marinobacter hydrocarbonoclasticus]|nr:DUF2057 domain-containing protein [Marinobacter nauticus]